MRIIIPMAGRGTRLRPHTVLIPKPLLPIAGKPMVQRIVEDLSSGFDGQVEEIAFITGDFGKEVETQLICIANQLGAEGKIYYQDEPLGIAHAILCAGESLEGNCIVVFSDTLFRSDFSFNQEEEGIIWVKKVKDPSSFGVVKVDENKVVTDFVEKSPVFVSDLAIVGIYYFRDATVLKSAMQYLIDNDIKEKGEYQLTTALENMKRNGSRFKTTVIEEWLDCGNKENVLFTNRRVLEIKKGVERLLAASASVENSQIIEPCFIGENVLIRKSVIGPHVSIGNNSIIENSVIQNSVVQSDSSIKNALLVNSIVGNSVRYRGRKRNISLGDYSTFEE